MTGGPACWEASRIDNDQCTDGEPIACSLTAAEADDRFATWAALLESVVEREATSRGVRVRLPAQPTVAADAARLAVLEADCCRFFTFTLRIDAEALWLEVEAPPDGRPLLDTLFTE